MKSYAKPRLYRSTRDKYKIVAEEMGKKMITLFEELIDEKIQEEGLEEKVKKLSESEVE